MIYVNKIDYISENHENNENDIRFNVKHRIYKRFNNNLINLELVLRSDIIIFDKYKTSAGFYKNELWLKFLYIMLFEKTFNVI